MEPVGGAGRRCALKYELVEGKMGADVVVEALKLSKLLGRGEAPSLRRCAWWGDVCRLACEMLRCPRPANGHVHGIAPVSAADGYRAPVPLAQWLKCVLAEAQHVDYGGVCRRVVNAFYCRRCRVGEL